ncbi:MAG TPA: tRNA-uridine aminocarboxypropyltransferase [Chitinivibrionales bacterium]|jgi:DTW domain-containing protein YfiP|nr:tRNA-uridine aminocarboxypropyltransferase [Chitinivibrionales bacterium]
MNTQRPATTPKKIDKKNACPVCLRPRSRCICGKTVSSGTLAKILILQHPQEQYKLLNSAMLAHRALARSVLRVGLSWRNLSHALGEEANADAWAVLLLKGIKEPSRKLEMFSPKNLLLAISTRFKGIIVIDGSWKQAKAMWWRNPWLLRLNRITLNPDHPSLRGQTKRHGLATVEAIAMALDCLGENTAVGESLRKQYEELIIRPNLNQALP